VSLADKIEAFAATRPKTGPKCFTCRDLSPEHQKAILQARERGVPVAAIHEWLESEGGYGAGKVSKTSLDSHLREKHSPKA
jgi:hypothetical protein